ncbi:MAG TPA: AraC family transcriptional regulator [Ohtaekwangia sp.]|uniref:helix-turn-helix transcriptional regulator n=1 Tax=Ohtaekwangia sp. TaxID=2066019 RepID=UPI002F95502B
MIIRFSSESIPTTVLKAGEVAFARYKHETTAHTKTVLLQENSLIFVLDGHKKLYFNDFSTLVEPGKILFMKRGLYVMSEFLEDVNYEALIIFCTDAFLKEFSLEHLSAPADIHPVQLTHLVIPTNKLLDSFKDQYLSYFDQSLVHLNDILQLKLKELFLLLISGGHGEQVTRWIQGIAYRQPVSLEYVIRQHLFQPLTLGELAELSGRSLASFKRDFQNLYGISPKKWINTQRLAHAQMLLRNTNQSVSEIAAVCGFDNIPYFIRVFKNEFGITPSVVRAKSAIV